eukprot:Protomagalhaensia_sp_Gyna_25__254@NODE_111_length_5195_cov_31_637704_g88_i0_p2_GENE_NODE_111_length_5195_cov_31_637704_g88_i0NODE_111_length_5195_cov_31_637704_g88_i0_p2_ORF_typecomplete_len378_score69_37ANAPC4_WD40/PF12894_7/3_4e15ANAPC4_WD40/PF12894_7/0_021ANAPC4_WD40/PF12894_7/7_6e05ANAPC4_WD40/PF12894_7/6_4e03WD40/PF00400_32/9_2e15WD40/PF00400_32/2_5e05WD40_like/PF17005_5/2_2e02WD40_like/PF17005_5/1_3e14Utp12/PF04003_12/9_7e12Ge1_WD40/PF16529_5/4_4e07Ge1_WD40/PF16529_5/0_14Nup160/PF11715_8/4
MLAIGLRDNTVMLMYSDSLKVHLTLYGHSLPVTCVAFSTDGQMLASGSADRHIKVWDVEFGNILRSLQASRTAAVTRVGFVFDTHYVMATLGNGALQLHDCDSGDRICTLQAGRSGLKCLAYTADAELILCGSEDGSIKVWERTDKQLILSEEREREADARLAHETATGDVALPGAAKNEITVANRATRPDGDSVRDTEHLIQVLDHAMTERNNQLGYKHALDEWENHPLRATLAPPPKPIPTIQLLGRLPLDHIITNISQIPSEILVETILGLPFVSAEQLFNFMLEYLERFCALLEDGNKKCMGPLLGREVELACRVALTIVQSHGRVLIANETHRISLVKLNGYVKTGLDHQLHLMRRNQVALKFLAGSGGSTV